MFSSTFAAQEEKLAIEGRLKYRGTARVELDTLCFPWSGGKDRNIQTIEKLKKCFSKGQCDRLTRNHIPAVITQNQLDKILQDSGVSKARLQESRGNYPEIVFPHGVQLQCLHGRHRIWAAKEVLPRQERWWTVDLFLANLDVELKNALIEEYSNEQRPSDGESYCNIRRYQKEGNVYSEMRWWSRLSEHTTRCLKQLFRHESIKDAFDNLVIIPGLWSGMRLSTLNRMISMRCDEEILFYLKHIKTIFLKIIPSEKLHLVDDATVKAIEGKAPRASHQDARMLHGKVVSGQIFSAFTPLERETIWRELSTINDLFPSLFTFFEDLRYLQACAASMRYLINPRPKETIRSTLDQMFSGIGKRVIEKDCGQYQIRLGKNVLNWELAYRQLWLAAMRKFPELPGPREGKREKSLRAKPRAENADEVSLANFASLANELGFQSKGIIALRHQSSDRDIARSALLKARKPDRFQYDDEKIERHINNILQFFDTAKRRVESKCSPALVSKGTDTSGTRYGLPSEEAHAGDSKFLFILDLHSGGEEQGETITSLFVRRSVYFSFFGRSEEISACCDSMTAFPSGTADDDAEDTIPQTCVSLFVPRNGEQGERTSSEAESEYSEQNQSNALLEISDYMRSHSQDSDSEILPSTEDIISFYNNQDYIVENSIIHGGAIERDIIKFLIYENSLWKVHRTVDISRVGKDKVEQEAKNYLRNGFRAFDSSNNALLPNQCLQATDGTNIIRIIPEDNIRIHKEWVPQLS